ncbi:MAG: undecaprenyldiphospho-muramoylpentapeptide beta-N-acetylglucosaminyltransferase [Alphaproteobacteria bacterium]|nr:undecaprenyldiphospho-muramoylpentapeptide beta-N-acetylglucosaminyltransferase [Alphaproteobacteria bacterium]
MSLKTDTSQVKKTVVLAAGGTGGHLFPAQALAEELLSRGIRVVLVTDRRFEAYVQSFAGVEVRMIRSATLSGSPVQKLKGALNILVGVLQSRRIIASLKPVAVVGFGGYPSFPTMAAAAWLRRYSIIHEQNSVLGRANRVLAGWVSKIATSFHGTSHVPEEAQKKLVFTGNPVRAGIRALRAAPYPALAEGGNINILVMGGSQGATVFSRVVPEAIRMLPPAHRARIILSQQCREADLPEVRAQYAELGFPAELATFFTDVPRRLEAAHLVITRSGASTVTELLTAGRPAILVPYPRAMDDHQTYNANTVEDAGGGWLMPEEGFTAEALSGKLEQFLALPSALQEAAAEARAIGHPEAAALLAALVLQETYSAPAEAHHKEHAA